MPFGQVIAVTGLYPGFPGTISRAGDGLTSTRSVLSTTTNPVSFGAPVVIVPESGGGDAIQSVYDYITGGGVFSPDSFAGVAVREVRSQAGTNVYPQDPESPQTGQYYQGTLASVLERGTVPVIINVGAPGSQNPVYIRTVANAGVTAGVVGGFECAPGATDLFTLAVGTGGAAAGQKVIPVASTTNVQVGQAVYGLPGIPTGSVVASLVANTSVTLNNNLTAALVAGDLFTLSNLVELPYTVFRSGVIGPVNQADITLKIRTAA